MSIIIVSGFGRCGSSLVMQMLQAGGVQVTGEWPAFEDLDAGPDGPFMRGCAKTAARFEGKAVKVLDPHKGRLPVGPDYRVVWCSRDYREQAKSQAKLLRLMMGMQTNRDDVRAFQQSYGRDKPLAIAALRKAGAKALMEVRFEDLLRAPQTTAGQLAYLCGLSIEAASRMAAAVHHRSPLCAPGMDMELALFEGKGGRP